MTLSLGAGTDSLHISLMVPLAARTLRTRLAASDAYSRWREEPPPALHTLSLLALLRGAHLHCVRELPLRKIAARRR